MNLKIISKITMRHGFPKSDIENILKNNTNIKNFSIEPFNDDIEYNFETQIDYDKVLFQAYVSELLGENGKAEVSEFELYINHDDALNVSKIESFIKDIVKSLPGTNQTMSFDYKYEKTQTI